MSQDPFLHAGLTPATDVELYPSESTTAVVAGAATVVGNATLTDNGTAVRVAAASLAGTGSLVASGTQTAGSSAFLAASVTLTASGTVIAVASAGTGGGFLARRRWVPRVVPAQLPRVVPGRVVLVVVSSLSADGTVDRGRLRMEDELLLVGAL